MAEHGMEFTRRDFVKGASVITGGIMVFGVGACDNTEPTTTAPTTSAGPTLQPLPAVKFQFSDTAGNRTIAQYLQGQMQQNMGINVTLEPMESAAFQKFVNEENHTWAWFGWGADYPDPENFLDSVFMTGAGNNHTLYSNAQFDTLMKDALKDLNNTTRLQKLDQAHKMMVEDMPMVFMFNRERFNLVKPALRPTLKPTGQDGQIMGDRLFRQVSMPGNILRVNSSGDPPTLDTNAASWASSLSCLFQIYDGLFSFDQNLNVQAMVASEIPTTANGGISSDGLTYTFKLKPNVTWSDGKPVTAQDFEYSIKRMLAPATAAEYSFLYLAIAGAEAYNAGTGQESAVGVRAINTTTLEVKLTGPQPTFISRMALWPVYPVRKDIVDAKGADAFLPPNLIGNGPFMLTEWVPLDHMTFKVNPNYWATKPTLTEIRFRNIPDPQASLAAYQNNELDMSGVPVGTEKATMADATLGPQVFRNADLTTFGFQFNVKKAPFDNKKVRQAFSCAIDRDTFINSVRGGVGKATTSWIPPGMPGYDAAIGADYKFNVAKAKQLLAEGGYKV
ncbi:MAG: ABC transporter substrate-binding protein [Dehalogenimonas sp.]